MRIAIVSDIHGNLPALEAVLADLRNASPDLVLHGGDLAHGGANPAAVIDRIGELGWQGVLGNADEQLTRPQTLHEFIHQTPPMQPHLDVMVEMADWTAERLGGDRIAWLRRLPLAHRLEEIALVHASPADTYRSPGPEASDAELESAYAGLGTGVVVYGHIHVPYVRQAGGRTIVNTGSVSLSFDGDRRAAYLLLDDGMPVIRRVNYDVDLELGALARCGMPHWGWTARMIESARPQMP